MLEIERIVQAKLDDGQTVEDLEKDFDKLVIECLPALTARNRQVETLPPLPCPLWGGEQGIVPTIGTKKAEKRAVSRPMQKRKQIVKTIIT